MLREDAFACGCNPQGPCCEVGRTVFHVVATLDAYIQSRAFLLLSFAEREQVWSHYYAAVEAYQCHCGYVDILRPA